jgi:hypothetical protein
MLLACESNDFVETIRDADNSLDGGMDKSNIGDGSGVTD